MSLYIVNGNIPFLGTVTKIRLIHGLGVHLESVARRASTLQPFSLVVARVPCNPC